MSAATFRLVVFLVFGVHAGLNRPAACARDDFKYLFEPEFRRLFGTQERLDFYLAARLRRVEYDPAAVRVGK